MTNRKLSMLTAAGLAALALASCREDGRSARIAVPDPTPPALLALSDDGLPYANPAPVGWYEPERGYQWGERAYGMQRAFHDAPPDYAFDYGGRQPWVWETEDDWAMYAEPYDDGYRYYYYEPEAAYPYFVRDDRYGYGYDAAGLLVALFDSDGDYLPVSYYDHVAPLAGRYYAHGRDLRNHAVRAPRISVTQDTWNDRAPRIVQTSQPWLRAAREDDNWRAWRDKSGERELKRFAKEERRRDKAADKWAREAPRDVAFAPAARGLREERVRQRREDRSGGEARAFREAQREDRGPARAAEAQARPAAFVERGGGRHDDHPKADRGGRADHEGGQQAHGGKPDHAGGRQAHGAGKSDRGGDKGHGGGKDGGKKD